MLRAPWLRHCIAATIASIALAPAPASTRTDRDCDGDVCIAVERSPNLVRFFADNRGIVPAALEVGFPVRDNLIVSEPTPLRSVVPAGTRRALLAIRPADTERTWRWRWRWRTTPGVLDAEHDDRVRYLVPWRRGQRHEVGQAVGGSFSHRGKSWFSWDFWMDVGTPVTAARGGTVIREIDSYSEGGLREELKTKANAVHILHEDGTIARYVHLRRGGVRVRVGDRVRAGETIAESGNTGYSSRPHLHLTVYKIDDALERQSLDIRFADGTPRGFTPVRGQQLDGGARP